MDGAYYSGRIAGVHWFCELLPAVHSADWGPVGPEAPLTALMGQGGTNKPLKLSTEELSAFEKIKVAVTSEPVLRAFDPDKPVAVFADSSDAQAGSFWAQDHGYGWQPGAFESHKLSPAERNYSIRDKELLAA